MPSLTQDQEQQLAQRLIQVRRELHQQPELSNEEFQTTDKLRRWLAEAGITVLDLPLPTAQYFAELAAAALKELES